MGSETMKKPALTKRQRRAQGSNPTTTWQQQPRIKSSAARARAYINYAGLADDNNSNDNNDNGDDDDEQDKHKIDKATGGESMDDSGNNQRKKKTTRNEGEKNNKGTKSAAAAQLLDPTLDLHSPEVKFGRMIGGTDQRARHRAVKSLKAYLRARADLGSGCGISELDLMKLWKGLWYTLYMADKVPVQDKLSQVLAELMWCLAGTEEDDEYAGQVYLQMEEGEFEDGGEDGMEGEEEDGEEEDDDDVEIMDVTCVDGEDEEDIMDEGDNEDEEGSEATYSDEEDGAGLKDALEKHCRGAHLVSLYIGTFLRTVRREWGNVDKHRIDKFYTAVRCMISEAYKYMAKRHWNLGIIRLFNDVFYEEALSHTPNGLRYHLIDICVDELAKVNKTADLGLTEATILDCLEPFFALAQKAGDKTVHQRVMEKVLLKFLNEYSFVSDAALGDDEDEQSLVFDQVHVGSVAKFIFEVASDSDTDERFRKALYEMHKTYVRQIRAAGRDVDLNDGEEDEDEVDDCCLNNTCNLDQNGDCEKKHDVHDAADDVKVKAMEEEDNSDEVDTAKTSEKKKKSKKKKGKDKNKENVEREEEEKPLDETAAKSSEKKKKSKKKKKEKEPDLEEVKEENQDDAPAITPPKKEKKKRKKGDGELTESAGKDAAVETKADPIVSTPTQKKKRQKQISPPSVDPRSMIDSDGVDNRAPEREASSDEAQTSDSAAKRVVFGRMNHCKSWKASMKALNTLDQQVWSTANRTPDKGILQPPKYSDKKAKQSSKKKKAKKQK